jgi:hypothetical protein
VSRAIGFRVWTLSDDAFLHGPFVIGPDLRFNMTLVIVMYLLHLGVQEPLLLHDALQLLLGLLARAGLLLGQVHHCPHLPVLLLSLWIDSCILELTKHALCT